MNRQSSAKQMNKKKCTAIELGFPKIEHISYMNLKAQPAQAHDDCLNSNANHSSKAFVEM